MQAVCQTLLNAWTKTKKWQKIAKTGMGSKKSKKKTHHNLAIMISHILSNMIDCSHTNGCSLCIGRILRSGHAQGGKVAGCKCVDRGWSPTAQWCVGCVYSIFFCRFTFFLKKGQHWNFLDVIFHRQQTRNQFLKPCLNEYVMYFLWYCDKLWVPSNSEIL